MCVALVAAGGSGPAPLERFLMDACGRHVRVAVKAYWVLTAWMDDKDPKVTKLTTLAPLPPPLTRALAKPPLASRRGPRSMASTLTSL